MKAAIGLIYLLGVFRANRMDIEDAWATDGTRIEIFSTIMFWQHFCFFLGSTRFDDIHTRDERRLKVKFASFKNLFEKIFNDNISSYNVSYSATVNEMLAPLEENVLSGCTVHAKYASKIWHKNIYFGRL